MEVERLSALTTMRVLPRPAGKFCECLLKVSLLFYSRLLAAFAILLCFDSHDFPFAARALIRFRPSM
jgi:hypothetical protein